MPIRVAIHDLQTTHICPATGVSQFSVCTKLGRLEYLVTMRPIASRFCFLRLVADMFSSTVRGKDSSQKPVPTPALATTSSCSLQFPRLPCAAPTHNCHSCEGPRRKPGQRLLPNSRLQQHRLLTLVELVVAKAANPIRWQTLWRL